MREAHILHLPPGTDVAGFTVGPLLGAGGCGAVYRAARGGEEVALKLQSLRRLAGWPEREGAILLRLRHRNVVGFRACGVYPGGAPHWFYLAMEYVRGRTLQQWVDEENPGARRVAELLLGMARGLAATHSAEVLHRDIKEHNVVVREEDGEAVLVDFGVGDYAGAPRLTHGVLPPGTPRYRSPEALAFRRASSLSAEVRYAPTPADDLYALGVVFYWMLTGRHPFGEVETATEVEQVISQLPPAPHVANPRVPEGLSGLCMKLLSKEPEERGTAVALGAAVEQALAGVEASWDVPLCDEHPAVPEPAPVWPEDDAEALDLWVRVGSGEGGPPRRGKRPGAVGVERGPEGPLAKGLEVAPTRLLRARAGAGHRVNGAAARAGFPARGAVLLAVGAVLAGAVMLARVWLPGTLLPEARREVAPSGPSPESELAALPLQAATTAAATALLAVSAQKEDTPVKKTPDLVSPLPSRAPSRPRGTLGRTLTTAAACTALACSGGPQVRPPPAASEPCPEKALKAMEALGIRMGGPTGLVFRDDGVPARFITVREESVKWRVGPHFGALAKGWVSGRVLIRGDRVSIRFTEGHGARFTEEGVHEDGKTYPVCLSVTVLREDRGGAPDSARIFSSQRARAVPSFE